MYIKFPENNMEKTTNINKALPMVASVLGKQDGIKQLQKASDGDLPDGLT